ncbi:hypothetical protein SARC_01258 [Sphaeroforma arctica JP610]|uniref:Right handed beta helix domain-containing protein n=1 Tax=Sphaeroforma arctica JP610 TaxID=667725 RepID=A0A0L0GC62_9EUKA|nr:hypothetical protein SARC_01258 [Sphaeroforma arctica JP610]KNC86577.1 hypothetical protein SARC_01258 [Sphaeroforma arctica JP610]|eukprot:XP_014160479.1 hypothetical protein SARC_01258 [Sphaeroforma arctica JP610]
MRFIPYLVGTACLGYTAAQSVPTPAALLLPAPPAPSRPSDDLVNSSLRVQVCKCGGAVVNEVCYDTLEKAVDKAVNDDYVFIGGTHYVDKPIQFTYDLNFVGVLCSGDRAKLVAKFDRQRGAILEAVRYNEQTILLANLDFTGTYGNSNSGFHTRGQAGASGGQRVSLGVYNTNFYDMSSKRDGAGIFIGVAEALTISSDCTFENLKVATIEKGIYAGGPALTIAYVPPYANIDIDGTYFDNSARFVEGSKHSDGGVMHFSTVDGVVNIQGYYYNNVANQGGAIFVEELVGTMFINGHFEANQAIDDDYGARGGALRVVKLFADSQLQITGTFKDNRSAGKAAVLALNIVADRAVAYLSGRFEGNTASGDGGVISVWSSTSMKGALVIDGNSQFKDNTVTITNEEPGSSLIYVERPRMYYSENDWSGSRMIVSAARNQVVDVVPKKW